VQGKIGTRDKSHIKDLFVEIPRELCIYALLKNVSLILEPVNRYEINFLNSVE
jgi:hypothetical protein